jgi:hypothetical protein
MSEQERNHRLTSVHSSGPMGMIARLQAENKRLTAELAACRQAQVVIAQQARAEMDRFYGADVNAEFRQDGD